jgi:hypothetical protein
VTDALDKAAAALDDATDSATSAADTVKAETAKVADTVAAKAGAVADKADAAASDTPPPRSMDEIEAELQVTRDRLAGRIDDLADYVKPANVVERQKAKLRSLFVDEYGGIKPDRVLVAAGAVVAVLGLGVLRRRRRRA